MFQLMDLSKSENAKCFDYFENECFGENTKHVAPLKLLKNFDVKFNLFLNDVNKYIVRTFRFNHLAPKKDNNGKIIYDVTTHYDDCVKYCFSYRKKNTYNIKLLIFSTIRCQKNDLLLFFSCIFREGLPR